MLPGGFVCVLCIGTRITGRSKLRPYGEKCKAQWIARRLSP